MDLIDQLKAIASRAGSQLAHIATEEATKNALVMPFINALGYNVFDPTEVVPEFVADVGLKKGEKVDYAIMIEGKPLILFECKQVGASLSTNHASQLFRYFTVTDARIGVLTNGFEYRFFSDLEAPNKMDSRPFLEVDIRDINEHSVQELKKLGKAAFNLDEVLSSASELKYLRAMRQALAQEWQEPSEELVRLVISKVYDGRLTQAVRDQFGGLVKRALQQFLNERITERISTALVPEAPPAATLNPDTTPDASGNGESVVTTAEEMEAFYIVRAILREAVDVARVAPRDVKSYFGVLLDDNNRKPICRFHFNTGQKYLGLFSPDKQENRVPIASLDNIYDHAEYLKRTVLSYNGE